MRWVIEYISENTQKWEDQWLVREQERYEENPRMGEENTPREDKETQAEVQENRTA